eukprot:scaffold102920_cov63-Phaeocystis_antarctica.AAC.3
MPVALLTVTLLTPCYIGRGPRGGLLRLLVRHRPRLRARVGRIAMDWLRRAACRLGPRARQGKGRCF